MRYFDVGRQPNDYNGDGFADVAVGAPGHDRFSISHNEWPDYSGRVLVYSGSRNGRPKASDRSIPSPTLAIGAQFGYSVASAGDVNGDGYADLVVGARDASAAYVFYGGPTGLSSQCSSDTCTELASPVDELFFWGHAVAGAGDVNGDGFADVAVGGLTYSGVSEQVTVHYGSATGVAAQPSLVLRNPDNVAGDFGSALSGGGDLDGDGSADLVSMQTATMI